MFLGWPQFDQDMAIALARLNQLTGEHGEWLPDATSERADPEYYEDDAIRFEAVGPFTNYAVKSVRDARTVYEKKAGEGANLNGKYWAVKKVEY